LPACGKPVAFLLKTLMKPLQKVEVVAAASSAFMAT